MREVRRQKPRNLRRRMVRPVEKMNVPLAEHYGKKADVFRRAARGYVDDRLREVFPASRARVLLPAGDLLRRRHAELLETIVRWSSLDAEDVEILLRKLENRTDALGLRYPKSAERIQDRDVVALAEALALDYAYTGRLTG